MKNTLDDLKGSLYAFDASDLCAGIGALQLVPVNAERQLRFERAAALVVGAPRDATRPRMSPRRWRAFLNSPPIADESVIRGEDPAENVFTGTVTFHGGAYTVFMGIADDSALLTQVLLHALNAAGSALPHEFVREMNDLALCVLRIGNALADRADLARNVLPDSDPDRRVIVPSASAFNVLKAAVTFSDEGLEALCYPVSPDVLEPIVSHSAVELNADDLTDLAYTYVRPIVRHGGSSTVITPSGLLVSLRHRIVIRALAEGLGETLTDQLTKASAAIVDDNLKTMRWAQHSWGRPDRPNWAEESFWGFDSDKGAHVLVVGDDLHDYSEADPFAGGWSPGVDGRVQDRISVVSQALFDEFSSLTSVLHIVVLCGVGRAYAVDAGASTVDQHSSFALLSQSELGIISRYEAGDQLALWKFTTAEGHLRQTVMVHAWSTLDKYGAYRTARHSFYLSDQSATFLQFHTSYGNELRIADATRFDIHAVPHWDGTSVIEVQRFWETTEIPVYAPRPALMEQIEFLIEDQPMPIWVHQRPHEVGDGVGRSLLFEMCETVTFWLWRAAPGIQGLLTHLAQTLDHVEIAIDVVQPDLWTSVETDTRGGEWCEIISSAHGVVELALYPSTQLALSGPDNSGERHILTEVVAALIDLVEPDDVPDTRLAIEAVVDSFAPLGQMKKVMFLDTAANLSLLPGRLPHARSVREADIEQILDHAGPELASQLGIEPGPISPERHVEVLNTAVEIYLREFEELVVDLGVGDLLDRLVTHHEAIVQALAHQRLTLPTQLACFGNEPGYVNRITDRIEDLTRADQSTRFVIEYVVAQPPHGTNRLSLSTFDRLIALANEIINKGMLSDAVFYGLADLDLSILPTGRLGINRDSRYVSGVEAFRSVKATSDKREAIEHFGSHWRSGHPAEPLGLDALNTVTEAEFGLNMTEHAHLVRSIIDLSLALDSEVRSLPHADVLKALVESLGWPMSKVARGINNLSLQPRATLFDVSYRSDVFPWRFNRDLSYIRRPLLVRIVDDEPALVWGVRHLDRSGSYLLDAILSGRLKGTSAAMRTYLGTVRTEANEQFNDAVADAFERNSALIVKRRVKTFGPLRIQRTRAESLGDIDVLVIDQGRRKIVAVEAKDFEQARNPFELQREVKKLFDGKKSAAHHHSERLDWLRQNLSDVLAHLEIRQDRRRWQVEGLIVVSRDLLSPYITESPIETVTLQNLAPKLK